jgi:hypothetical protein
VVLFFSPTTTQECEDRRETPFDLFFFIMNLQHESIE